ncbi:MAG: hypothetical protein EBU22_02075 [Actinobacteria bacterium]|nr:hypothetical protein [Actinomycetota bacterium]NBY62314.1 hypothetical protein [Actinomycetota bacterium]NDF87539.1 hypothetical protein [Actinomycetota bacterium]HBQ51819.1 hypothetical protein [Acidimicrobium sp.]
MNPLNAPRRISFDLATIASVARKRWWVVPITMLVGAGLMFFQESDLQTEPRYYTLTRTYEALNEMAPLALVDLNPALFEPIPSETSQLAVLRSQKYLDKALTNIKGDLDIRVDKSETRFALTTEGDISEARRFSFSPATNASFTFTCTEQDEVNCASAIENYLQLLITLRAESIKTGLSRSLELVDQLLNQSAKITESQRDRLTLQKIALQESVELASGEMQLIAEDKYFGGEQITTVGRKTYLFGLLVGLIIGCLILLQLVISDNVIRDSKKLVSLVGFPKFLGNIDKKRNPNSIQHIATAIRGATTITGTTTLRVLPVDSHANNEVFVGELAGVLGCKATLINSVADISAAELSPNLDSPILIFVNQHKTKISDLESAWTLAEKSGNTVVGAVLVSN